MPLATLLILVVGGISMIAVLLHLLGKSAPLVLTADTARAAWLRQFPDDPVQDVTVAETGQAALIAAASGPGLIWSFGADTVARPLSGVDVADTGSALRIRFPDHTAPSVTLRLDAPERARWQTLMRSA